MSSHRNASAHATAAMMAAVFMIGPRILSATPTQRAADGLLAGLSDSRFKVRFQCSRALSHICDRNPDVRLDPEKGFAAAIREVAVDRQVWEGHQLLDQFEEKGEVTVFEDRYLRKRAVRSLEHVFTVLSLALPKEPLRKIRKGGH